MSASEKLKTAWWLSPQVMGTLLVVRIVGSVVFSVYFWLQGNIWAALLGLAVGLWTAFELAGDFRKWLRRRR